LANGCSKSETPDSASSFKPTEAISIEPGICVGDIRKGMTLSAIIGKLGEPDRHSRSSNILEYAHLGLGVIASSKDNIVRVVMCGDASGLPNSQLVKAFTGRTKEGIGMGSKREDVIKAYGETKDTVPLPPGQENLPGRETLVYKNLGLTFSLADGKVHHIIVDFRIPN